MRAELAAKVKEQEIQNRVNARKRQRQQDYEREQGDRAVDVDCRSHMQALRERVEILVIGLEKDARILDAGCRNGQGLLALQELGYNNTIGIDVVKKNVLSCMDNGLRALYGDIEELGKLVLPESFDAVLLSHTLEHIRRPEVGLKAIYTVLRPKGRMLIIVPVESSISKYHYSVWKDPKVLEDFVKECGFGKVEAWKRACGTEIWCTASKQ